VPQDPRPRLVVLSEPDPVAHALAARWGTAPPTGLHVDGVPIRELERGLLTVRRPGLHLQDDDLELRLPLELRERSPTVIFPSIHRSESGIRCFTVHPLGNPGSRADFGGKPGTLVPADPRLMTAVLRALAGDAGRVGLPATFEATHHGPALALPSLFAEVAVPAGAVPLPTEVEVLEHALREATPESADRVALAVGGGHYAPRFTDLARGRRWAFGHILSRHALRELTAEGARAAWQATPAAEGILCSNVQEREHRSLVGLGPMFRETDAPPREGGGPPRASGPSLPSSGT
jgi:D-tyrosyl-tRNA(Tyr) deacylase